MAFEGACVKPSGFFGFTWVFGFLGISGFICFFGFVNLRLLCVCACRYEE